MSERKLQRNGRPKSPRGVRSSKKPNDLRRNPKLAQLLARVYSRYQRLDDPAADKQCREDFVFHMSDWAEDLQRLADLFRHPDHYDDAQAGDVVAPFLFHVIPHLTEAGRLMLDYEPGKIFDSPKRHTPTSPPNGARTTSPPPSKVQA